ncbi:MAG: YDG domain-containing protein, partial [Clostridia bacterium]
MKKEFTSTDSYRGDGRNPLSLVEPDIAGHEARQALYRKKRVNIAIVSVILCLVVIASAVFALYTATDLFKTQDDPADLAIDKDDDGLVKTTVVDLASFEAVKNGDYSAFKGINVSEIAELQPFLIGYRLEVIDESVAKIISGMLYGLRPGTTLVEIYSMDGKKVNSFALQVLDAKGKLYYNVVFEYPNADPVVYEVISGRTLNEHNFELPTLPARTGYIPAHWELDGEKFFPTEKIESDITLSVKWNTVAVIFNAVPNLSGQYIEFFEHDLSQYASYGSGDFNFEAASTLPSGLKLEADGRLVGYPTNVIMSGTPAKPQFFSFDVKVIDAVNDTADVVSMNFKAMPRVADIVFSGFNLTYNGGAQTIGVSIQNLAIEDAGQVSVMLDYGANKASVKNADNYTATAVALQGARAHCYTLPEETVAKSFTVQPYTAEIHYYSSNINDQNFNLIYNAKPQTIFAEVVNVFDGDTANITLGYSLSDAERIAVQNGITASVLTIDNPNYIIKNNQPNKVFNIVKAELNVVVHPAIKVYNKGADPVFAFDITGEQSDIDDRSEEDMLRNILKDCIQRAAGENVGAYALTINPATSSDPQLKNYEISVIPSTLMITKRSVGIVASEEIVKTYDGSDSVNMDALMFAEENIVDGTGKLVADADLLSFSAKYEAAGASQNDIPVAITLSGVAKGNYELVGEYTGRIEKFEINTLQGVSASNKVYDNTFTATVNLKAKGVGGVDIPLTGISAAFENSYVGTHNINIFAAQVAGADESNYTVTATALESVALSATIEPREVNLNTAEVAFVKYYDGTTNLPENINYRAILGVIDGTVLEFIGSFASATAGEDKTLVLELDPATNPNENYVLAGVYKGTIDKKNVFLNGAVSKEYDASTDLPAIELLGLVEGDEMDVTVSGSYADKNAGENKTVTLNLGGGKAANYNLIFGGKGRIAAKIITVTSDFNKIYDGTTVFNNALTLNGVISGDIVNYDAAYTSKAATLATVTVTLVGLDASNYVLESASFAGEIAKAVITLESFAALNKVYDGTTSAVYASPVFSGKISGDDVAVSGIEPKFDDKNIGTDKLVAIDTTDLFLTGADNANYYIDNNIITTTANITKATVAISGNFDKFFDNTAQFTNALTLNGVVAGDEVGYFAEYASKDAAANIAVNITLNGADSGNYTLATSYTGKINQAVITGITGVAANS